MLKVGVFNRNDTMLIQNQYDFLLFFIEAKLRNFTLKFYEYINANKPIICVGGKPNSESKRILNYLERGVVLDKKNYIIEFLKI